MEVVYVVKVVIIVGIHSLPSHIDAGASVAESESDSRPRYRYSDKFQRFNHGEELNSTVQLQTGPVTRCSWCML
jgi:hypothetical protein